MDDLVDAYMEERKQFHLSNGCIEETAVLNSWSDYWKKENDEHGVTLSIHELLDGVDNE